MRDELLNIQDLLLLLRSPPEVFTPVDCEDVIKIGSTLFLPDLGLRPGLDCCFAVKGDRHVVDEPSRSKKSRVRAGVSSYGLVWVR